MRASNAGATLNEPARFTEAVLFEPTAWKSCEGYVYGDRHSASPATAAPPPSLPLPLSHRSRRHPAEPTRLAGSSSRMERQRRSGLWLGAWECRRQHAQRSMPGAAPSVPTTFVDEGGRWPIATIVTKCCVMRDRELCKLSWVVESPEIARRGPRSRGAARGEVDGLGARGRPRGGMKVAARIERGGVRTVPLCSCVAHISWRWRCLLYFLSYLSRYKGHSAT